MESAKKSVAIRKEAVVLKHNPKENQEKKYLQVLLEAEEEP